MSRVLSLLCLAIFSLSFATALRSRLLTRWTGRLERQYRVHHGLGIGAAVAIVSHIIWELSAQPWSLSQELIFTGDPALLAAWTAVSLFLIAFVLSYMKKQSHRRWYGFHLLFPLAFFVAVFHAYAFRTQDVMDGTIIGVSAALGCSVLLLMGIRRFGNPRTNNLKIKGLRKLTDSTWEVDLALPDRAKDRREFRAGDIVYVRFPKEGYSRALHPFTVASCRFESDLRLYIKSLGRDTSHLQDLTKGAELQIIGPYTELRPDASRPQIWVAGGIGIAPFLGFLHCMDYEASPHPVRLMHFMSSANEQVAQHEVVVDQNSKSHDFQYQPLLVENKQLDFFALDQAINDLGQPLILVCGPDPFMRAVRKHLKKIGVAGKNIVTEEFIP